MYGGLKLSKSRINNEVYTLIIRSINMPLNAPKAQLKINEGINYFIKM